jgi:peptidyl-prolyl cis-trans isomerase A (cyclophilin A)
LVAISKLQFPARIDVARNQMPPDDTHQEPDQSTAGRLLAMRCVRSTLTIAFFTAACCVAGCGRSAGGAAAVTTEAVVAPAQASVTAVVTPTSATRLSQSLPKPVDPMVVLHTTAGDITLQLFAERSPRTVENFLRTYAERGFYDQTIFHHAEPGVMLIAGGYTADLQRKPVRAPIYNESRNGLSNRRGTVAMIRDADAPHSASSEFFINLADNPDLDFKASDEEDVLGYCVFGEIIGGMDVVDQIAHLPTMSQGDFQKIPSPAVTITSAERLQ